MSEGDKILVPQEGTIMVMADFPRKGVAYIQLDTCSPGRVLARETLDKLIDCLSHARDMMDGLTTDVFVATKAGKTTVGDIKSERMIDAITETMRPLSGPKVQSETHRDRVVAAQGGYNGRVFVLCTDADAYRSWKAQHGLGKDPRLEYIARYDGFTRIQGYEGPKVNRWVIVGGEAPWMSAWTRRMTVQGFGEMTPREVVELLKGDA